MTSAHCDWCEDEFWPVEYASAPVDPDEPRFCCVRCEDEYLDAEELSEEYGLARHSGAPVF